MPDQKDEALVRKIAAEIRARIYEDEHVPARTHAENSVRAARNVLQLIRNEGG